MRVLVFEAVTGGGMWLFGDQQPPASLIAEGLAMTGGLTADLLSPAAEGLSFSYVPQADGSCKSPKRGSDAPDAPDAPDATDATDAGKLKFVNLARSIVGCISRSLATASSIEVVLLWDERLGTAATSDPRGALASDFLASDLLAAIKAGQEEMLPKKLPCQAPEISIGLAYAKGSEGSGFEELRQNHLRFATDKALFQEGWKLDSWRQKISRLTQSVGVATYEVPGSIGDLNHRLHVISVDSLAATEIALRDQAAQADAIVLIAPEPTQRHWQSLLSFAEEKIAGSSLQMVALCEDKLLSTSIPSLRIQPGDSESSSKAAGTQRLGGGKCADVDTDEFERLIRSVDTLCVKPSDSCGSTDVWRLQLCRPFESHARLTEFVLEMRRELKIETPMEQSLLVGPWVHGMAFSISMIVESDHVRVLPACKQILKFDRLVVPAKFADQLKGCQKVSYTGGILIKPELAQRLQRKTFQELQKLFTPEQLASLCGWVGIDAVAAADERVSIVEVNSRLTSSYNLLRQLRPLCGNGGFLDER